LKKNLKESQFKKTREIEKGETKKLKERFIVNFIMSKFWIKRDIFSWKWDNVYRCLA